KPAMRRKVGGRGVAIVRITEADTPPEEGHSPGAEGEAGEVVADCGIALDIGPHEEVAALEEGCVWPVSVGVVAAREQTVELAHEAGLSHPPGAEDHYHARAIARLHRRVDVAQMFQLRRAPAEEVA